ncbi:MAG: AMIN domain-containing protein [Campylobacterota bacterium]|nr:AMIN domain-containing protein [Campylobacterota bacterium]
MKIVFYSILISVYLFGRLNPFEATDSFNEKKLILENDMKLQEETKKSNLVKQDNIAVETKKVTEKKDIKILPFVNMTIVNDKLTIKVDKKYKLLNQDIIKSSNKILFDFQGDVSFYTIRKKLNDKNFKSFAVGTHRKEKYFRVVIELTKDLTNYKEEINSKDGIITINKI